MGLFSGIKNIRNELKEKREDCINKFNVGGKPIASIMCTSIDGQTVKAGTVLVSKAGVLFKATMTLETFFIPIESITRAEAKTDEEISRDVTLARLAIFGVFAFGMKKKKVEKHYFLILTYNENGIETTTAIECKMAANGARAIMQARLEYGNEHPEAFKEAASTTDIPEQIKKLSELRDQGILTSEEFETKKKELLAKM